MIDVDLIEAYVRELEAALRRAGRPTQPLVDEATAHLFEDAARIARVDGCTDAEAARRAIDRFGAVTDVVAAARKHARIAAANVARAASIVLMAMLAWKSVEDLVDFDGAIGWPLVSEHMLPAIWFLLFGELAFVSWSLWRALRRGTAPRWLATALQLDGALASALLFGSFLLAVRRPPQGPHAFSVYTILNLLPPLWLAMSVQSVAGLVALRQQATQVGQPSSPVELQPPG